MVIERNMLADVERPSELIPRGLVENVQFRVDLRQAAASDEAVRQAIVNACTRDPFFFYDAFVWVHDPKRHPDHPDRPFITWPFQREVLEDIDASIGRKSLGIVKSRDVGGSTMPLASFWRVLLFKRGQTLMLMSRNEKFVDDPRNPDSLFYKLDYMRQWTPSWMTAGLDRVKLAYTNTSIGSSIIGSSTTGDAGRGGRKQGIFIDEFAAFDVKESFAVIGSVAHNTRCMIYASTPQGVGNGFHTIISEENVTVHRLHWTRHPVHGQGQYTAEDGKVKFLDAFWETATVGEILDYFAELKKHFPDKPAATELARLHYKFVLDGKVRAPYYDHCCLMTPVPRLIAQELEMDFIGSGSTFFDRDEIDEYIAVSTSARAAGRAIRTSR
jgi:hypothetical protein